MQAKSIFYVKKISFGVAFVLCLSIIFSIQTLAQEDNIYSHNSFAEKIYLQLDSEVYTNDQSIWFKSIASNAILHSPTELSGVLYVELIGPDENIIERKIVKLRKGIGDGSFELKQDYAEGLYLIRAYTEWNKNFKADFIFKKYIHVFASSKIKKVEPIGNLILVENENNSRNIKAELDPKSIDSLQKKEVTLFLSFDEKKDTLSVKKNKEGKYLLNYNIPPKSKVATIQLQSENLFKYSKTLALDEIQIDLQFFPEGGALVNGIASVVGFKAIDYSGKGIIVEGEILNTKSEVVSTFKSNKLGMGVFTLSNPDKSTKYSARLTTNSAKSVETIYHLPKVTEKGNVLSISKNRESIDIKVYSNYLIDDPIIVWVSSRGSALFKIDGELNKGKFEISLPSDKLPEGIVAFSLGPNILQPMAERLFFNVNQKSRIQIEVSTDDEIYDQRDLTELKITTTNHLGEPVQSNMSVLVLNKEQMGEIQRNRENVLSYFLISSDLKGKIEKPGYYFLGDTIKMEDINALMLTQGWRKYHYTQPINDIIFQPESHLSVSGTLTGTFANSKKKKNIDLTIVAFGYDKSFQTTTSDSAGRFRFSVDDTYGDELKILVQSAKKSGKRKTYTVDIDKKEPPPIDYNHVITIQKIDSVVNLLVEKNLRRKLVDDAFRLSSGSITLDEILVKDTKITEARKSVEENYGKADKIIAGEDIQENEEKWSYGLYSVILFNYPREVKIRNLGGNLFADVTDSGPTLVVINGKSVSRYKNVVSYPDGSSIGSTLVLVDGKPVTEFDYHLISRIPPSEVSSFEILKHAKNFKRLFSEVFPRVHPLEIPAWGSVISIYTHGGNGIHGVSKPQGISFLSIKPFSPRAEFYSPKYKNLTVSDWEKPDLRAMVHWQPQIISDDQGNASTDFYNSDNVGQVLVVIEAISENGEIGYNEIEYLVKKRN